MYYQKENKSVNNDYYNTYKGYVNRDKNEDTNDVLSTIIKILAIVFLLTLIIFGYIFVSNQYYLSESSKHIQRPIKESVLGVNTIQSVVSVMSEEAKKLSSEDVSKIVQMVMVKMNRLSEQEEQAKLKSDIMVGRKPTTSSKKVKFIVVKGGDTLSTIAIRAYGNENAYKKIRDANREIIKDTNKIFAGQRLRIPL